jgi:hypothetical protein
MNESASTPFDAAQPLWQMWWDFLSRTTAAGLSFPPASTPGEAARSTRTAMFRAWGEGWQEFMRSPEFLATMTKSLEASLKGRQQWAEQLGQMQSEMQAVSRQDFDRLVRSLQGFEERVDAHLEEISAGLADLRTRLQKLEAGFAKDRAE